MPSKSLQVQKPFAATIPGLVASAKKRRATNRLQKRSAKAAALDVLAAPKPQAKALERFSDEGMRDAGTEEEESESEDVPLGSLSVLPLSHRLPLPLLLDCIFRKPVGQLLRVGAGSKYYANGSVFSPASYYRLDHFFRPRDGFFASVQHFVFGRLGAPRFSRLQPNSAQELPTFPLHACAANSHPHRR